MERLFCYVDESGQHTQGAGTFVVSVVVVGKDRDHLSELLEGMEGASGKNATKWMKSSRERKDAYLRLALAHPLLHGRIFFSTTEGSRSYQPITLATVAAAVQAVGQGKEGKASVFIDGLKRPEYRAVSTGLHRMGVATDKVRGVADESSALIRLADAVAGLAREAHEGKAYAQHLLEKAVRDGTVIKV
jgi:hypothetical protein